MADSKQAELVSKLKTERAALLAFFNSLDQSAWQTAVYSEDANWTIADLLRHLVDAERGMTGLITQWQQGNNPVPPDFDLARWNNRVIQKTSEKTTEALLADLQQNRSALLSFIETLQPNDWAKQGRHGSLQIMSIEQVCHLIADHEMEHLAVMEKALEKLP